MPHGEVPNFGSLDQALQAAERDVLTEITPEVTQDRQSLVGAFQGIGVARLELGKAIATYRRHFKAKGAWMRIAPVLLQWIDRTSLATLYNLIGDAERDQSLSGPRREALERVHINPATRSNARIVETLAGGREDESPEAADKAVGAALEASKAHIAAPKAARSAAVPRSMTLDEFAADQIARAEKFAGTHPEENKESIASAVISRLQAWGGVSTSHATVRATQTHQQGESKHRSRQRSTPKKVVSMDGKPERKSPKPELPLFDFGPDQHEIA